MKVAQLFDNKDVCVRCGHVRKAHHQSRGSDNVDRVFCAQCPPVVMRMVGEEGIDQPTPFFLEGPVGSDPCYQERQAIRNWDNFLRASPNDYGTEFAIWERGSDANSGIRLTGESWRVDEIERIGTTEDVRRNIVYKYHLYWEQEGRCTGCNRVTWFDHMEMDRLTPGSAGGGYTVGNVQLLCTACNKIKGGRDMEYLIARLKEQGRLGP